MNGLPSRCRARSRRDALQMCHAVCLFAVPRKNPQVKSPWVSGPCHTLHGNAYISRYSSPTHALQLSFRPHTTSYSPLIFFFFLSFLFLPFFSFLSFLFLPFFSFSLRSAVDPRHRPAPVNALLGWRTRSCLVLPRPGLLLPWLSPAPGLLACCPAQLQHAGRIDTSMLVSHGSSQP